MVWALIATALYFFLPAYVANMAPVLLKKLPFLNWPIHERYFGRNKTWRGIAVGILAGMLTFWLQKVAYEQGFRSFALIDYGDFSLALGLLMGFGAIGGDLLESFYKRRQGISPGQPWVPWDQLDFVFGGIICTSFIYVPPAEIVMILLIASPLLHVAVNYLGYVLRIKKNKF